MFESLALEPDTAKRVAALKGESYGLYPAFVIGMLSAAGPDTVITDGNENSYYYSQPLEYFRAYTALSRRARG